MRLEIEDRVRTTKMAGPQDFSPAVRAYAKWNHIGKVVDVSDSHGLCYKVQHEDAECSQCWYNPEELEYSPVLVFDPFSIRCKKCGLTSAESMQKYCGDGRDKDNEHQWEKYEPAMVSITMIEPQFKMLARMLQYNEVQKYFTPDYHGVVQKFVGLVNTINKGARPF